MASSSRPARWSSRGWAWPAVAVSRVGLAGDGVNGMCSGGSSIHGVHSIGKAGQLRCRRAFARRSGCSFESLGLQPEQFDTSSAADCAAFVPQAGLNDWMLKPHIGSLGRGIRYLRRASAPAEARRLCAASASMVAMRHVAPLTVDGGYKFDLRTYLLIARTSPSLVFYHRGFARRADDRYSAASSAASVHVTNLNHEGAAAARSHESHFWSFERVGRALTAEHGLPPSHMADVEEEMRRVSLWAFQAMRRTTGSDDRGGGRGGGRGGSPGKGDESGSSGDPRQAVGTFQLFSLDWAVDTRGWPTLLECNAAPTMRSYPLDDGLTPAVYTTALELVALAQSATRLQLRPRRLSSGANFSFAGWRLLFNEIDEQERGQVYDACKMGRAPPR